tara:strand:+ start:2197 stop:2967 length:771 start_codon:yes stop_codon:yes gene_type:complete
MSKFNSWCDETENNQKNRDLTLLRTDAGRLAIGVKALAGIVPSHYASEDRVSKILGNLGKQAAADFVKNKLPQTKRIRSGDLGEILAISYVQEQTIWDQTVKKLRWKDHREMPMRGDDLLAIHVDDDDNIEFLKGESKSRQSLSKATVNDARTALLADNSRPTPHALAFLSDRLAEEGREDLSDLIDQAQYVHGIKLKDVSHMIFTFSGNCPEKFLFKDLKNYKGKVYQWSVGLWIEDHQKFIADVFEKVVADGNA